MRRKKDSNNRREEVQDETSGVSTPFACPLAPCSRSPATRRLTTTAMTTTARAKRPIMLSKSGGFAHWRQKVVTIPSTNPDVPTPTNRTLSCDHGYVEYFFPGSRAKRASSCGTARARRFGRTAGTAAKATRICSCGGIIPCTCGMARVSAAPIGPARRSPTRLEIATRAISRPGNSAPWLLQGRCRRHLNGIRASSSRPPIRKPWLDATTLTLRRVRHRLERPASNGRGGGRC